MPVAVRWTLFFTLLLTAVTRAAEPPVLQVDAPGSLSAARERVLQIDTARLATLTALVGLDDPGAPIKVLLADERSIQAAAVPAWVAGYAYAGLSTVVLLVERSPRYPDASLEELLRHEVAHVLIARAAGFRTLPRWFNEGLATVAGDSWGLDDRSQMALALVFNDQVPLRTIDSLFSGTHASVRRAYALSGAFVRDLLRRFGSRVARDILFRVSTGLSFEDALERSTGSTIAALEAAFWRRHSFWYRWVPILTSSLTLWIGITFLALLAFQRRRQRDAAVREVWAAEEAWTDEGDDPTLH